MRRRTATGDCKRFGLGGSKNGSDLQTKHRLYSATQTLVYSLKARPSPFAGGNTKFEKQYGEAYELARKYARDTWEEKQDPIPRIGVVAQEILDILGKDPKGAGLQETPTKNTIKGWIKHLAPPEASKPGRPPKR